MTPRQEAQIGKSYAEMTEDERKEWFGYCFKRIHQFENISESYVCDIRSLEDYGNGYGVIRWQPNPDDPTEVYDPQCLYDIDELKQYMEDYPEMIVEGWIAPPTEEEKLLTAIRTEWVNLTDDQLKEKLYSNQLLTFQDNDIWNGNVDPAQIPATMTMDGEDGASALSVDEETGVITAPAGGWIITWKNQHYTCDEATTLMAQYAGDSDEKANELKILRNDGKNYIRQLVDKFLAEHGGKPEKPEFPVRYLQ